MGRTDQDGIARLRGSIDGVLGSLQPEAVSAKALTDSYLRFRQRALALAPDEKRDEFESLFPAVDAVPSPSISFAGYDPIALASAANEARALLSSLSGWLRQIVD